MTLNRLIDAIKARVVGSVKNDGINSTVFGRFASDFEVFAAIVWYPRATVPQLKSEYTPVPYGACVG